MRSIFVDGREWFDKVNGNSYFSARVFVDGVEVARIPFQYGYGSAYESAAAWALQHLGFGGDEASPVLWHMARDAGADLYRSLQRVTKRECVGWGTPWANSHIVAGRYSRPFTSEERDALAVGAEWWTILRGDAYPCGVGCN